MKTLNVLKNIVVGLFFLGGLAILGGATLFMSSVALFTEVQSVEVLFPTIDNLQTGDDVLIHGFRVGQVEEIRYEPTAHPETPIVVRCLIPADVARRLGPTAGFAIHSAGPLGGRYVEITPGNPPPDGPIPPAQRPTYVGESAGDLFKQLEDVIQENRQNIADAIEAIRSVSQGVDRGEGAIGALLRDEDMQQNLADAVQDASDVIAGLKEDRSVIGFLLNNEEAREDLRLALQDIRRVANEVSEGDGLVARLIHSEKMGQEGEDAVTYVDRILYKVDSGQGTLGQIINNPRAWEEVLKILVLARETIEDLREQAPISTFVNALFATF